MTTNGVAEVYCLDSDALINIQRYYPEALKEVARYARKGTIVIPEGVYREICQKTDGLKRMVQIWQNKYSAVILLDSPELRGELVRIEKAYGERITIKKQQRKGFWKSKSGKRAADGQVVTVSKVKGWIAVSNDQAVQDASSIENVPCIGWQEFYRRMKQGFARQQLLPGIE